MAETASKSRPTLLVRGQLRDRSIIVPRTLAALLSEPRAPIGLRITSRHLVQQAERGTGRFAHGSLASREGERTQVRDAARPRTFATQKLAAPECPVLAETRPVPRDAEGRATKPVLCDACGHVRVVVLDPLERHAVGRGDLLGEAARCVVRVKIARDELRPHVVKAQKLAGRAGHPRRSFRGVQVAEVLADDDFSPDCEGHGALEVGAEGQHDRRGLREAKRQRRPAARPAQQGEPLRTHPGDGVVCGPRHGPIVNEKDVRDTSQAVERFLFGHAHRLVGQVAARAHDRSRDFAEKEPMKRRVGEHGADARVVGRDLVGNAVAVPPQQHDGSSGRRERLLLVGGQLARSPYCVERREHHRERLFLAAFARAKASDGVSTGCIDHELEAADALEREDLPGADCERRLAQGLIASGDGKSIRGQEREPRPARRAGDGLRMEAAIGRTMVFGGAVGAHREAAHRRALSIVRQAKDDGEPRATTRAVGERITVPPGPRRIRLGRTLGAHGQIGREAGADVQAAGAVEDSKRSFLALVDLADFDPLDLGR